MRHCVTGLIFSISFFSPPALSKHFFILFPHPETHKSTPTQPPSPLRALESNFLLIKFTIKGPLMPASATLPFVFCFFSLLILSELYLFLYERYEILLTERVQISLCFFALSSEEVSFFIQHIPKFKLSLIVK